MKKRYFGLDLIRAIAVLFVPAVHFFKNSSFYDVNLVGKKMFVLTFFRWLFFLCVPLFLLLTGYLKSNVEPGKKGYFKGLVKIITSYVFISIVSLIFRKFYLHENITFLNGLIYTLDFSAPSRNAWYIEMYIGLFILIPYLNVLYKNLKSKKYKQYLIFSLIAIASISPVINMIKTNGMYIKAIPDWWVNIYPLTYYFIGAYIKEYQIEIDNKKGILVFIGILLAETIITYAYSYKQHFSWGFFGGYNCIITIILSTLLFTMLYKTNWYKNWIKKPITLISEISLDIYLLSWISDNLIFTALNNYFVKPKLYWNYFIIIILATFTLATVFALIKKFVFFTVSKLWNLMQDKSRLTN